jgi:hypothetical protein
MIDIQIPDHLFEHGGNILEIAAVITQESRSQTMSFRNRIRAAIR